MSDGRKGDVESREPPPLISESRIERRIESVVERATTPRGAAAVIATASIIITLGAGILMTVADRDRYPTIGSGLWWAIQTTTTVGYGDNVPESAAGRFVAVVVMLFGIGFLTVITAAITSTFVAQSRIEQKTAADEPAKSEHLRQLDERLDRMEAELGRRLERIEAALTRRS